MRFQFIIVLFALVYACLSISSSVYGQEQQSQERRAKPILSNSVYRPINKAQEAMQSQDYATALSVLDDLLARGDKLKGYDRAKTLHLKTIMYIQQEKYVEAVESATQAIAVDALELETQRNLRYNLVSMLFVLERYPEAIEQLELWLGETQQLDAQANFTAAQLYLTVNKLDTARRYAEQGLQLHQADTAATPKENWYRLLLSIYGQLELYEQAANLAETIVGLWPAKFEYYQQLVGLYQQLDRQQEAWAMLSIAHRNALFEREDNYLRLLQMHRFLSYPYRGADIFQQNIDAGVIQPTEDNWEALANAWMQARQWQAAETSLQTAAQLSDEGQHWLRLCQIAFQDERWQQSLDYCNKAVAKGELGDKLATAWQLLAMIHYSTDDYQAAADYLVKCKAETTTQKDCGQHLALVNNLIAFERDKRIREEQEARRAEERQRQRDSMIEKAILMTD